MADAKALDKVRKLIALALNNPDEQEARSAALKAVQMIGANGFVVCEIVPTVTKVDMPDLAAQAFWKMVYQQQEAQAAAARQRAAQEPYDWAYQWDLTRPGRGRE